MKKLFILRSAALFLAFGVILASCKKEIKPQDSSDVASNSGSTKNATMVDEIQFQGETIHFEYYLDNQRQFNPKYDLDDERFTHIIEGETDVAGQDKTILIHSFTSNSAFHGFLATKQMDYTPYESFENDMQTFVDQNPNVILDCENGDCEEYMTFHDALEEQHFGVAQGAKAPTVIHDNVSGGSPAWVMWIWLSPWMAPGWNNRASSINNLNIFTFMSLYDKTFYRKRMATFIGFHGWQIIPFSGPLGFMNNKVSSAIH